VDLRHPRPGRYFIVAAEAGDYPLTVVATATIAIANMLSDIALAALDPRIRG